MFWTTDDISPIPTPGLLHIKLFLNRHRTVQSGRIKQEKNL